MSPSGKARGFDLRIPRFESWHPSQPLRIGARVSKIKIFSGNSCPQLAQKVVACRHESLGAIEVGAFSDGETMVEINENVRGCHIFIIQSTCQPVNTSLMELIIMTDAFRRASAHQITAVIPYFGYARQDRRVRSKRVPITSKVVADMMAQAGVDRIITVDLHADQIQGFFSIPVDNIYASRIILEDICTYHNLDDTVVVSPDVGGVVRARAVAKRLNDCDLAIIDKRRPAPNQSQVMNIIGEVRGRNCIIVDDIIDTAGTLCKAATALKDAGAKHVFAYGTHAVLSGAAVSNIMSSSLDEVVVTDSITLTDEAKNCPKLRQISLYSLIAETITRINTHQSVSSMFEDL